MPKTHASLSPTLNILLLLAWAAMAAVFLFIVQPHTPLVIGLAGGILGVMAGSMQRRSFREAAPGFTAATSLMEVRRALTATPWGRRYVRFLYASKFILLAMAFLLIREPLLAVVFGYLAGYFALMFARELVTLRDTFQLHRLASDTPGRT